MTTRHIVVGLDGSPGSVAAAQWCVEMAPLLDANVIAVDVLPRLFGAVPPVVPAALPVGYDAASRQVFTQELDDLCEPFKSAGIEFRPMLLEGDAAETLMQVADDVGAALIVVGRRGRGWLKELVLGSVPHHLSHHAARPIVVVPRGPTSLPRHARPVGSSEEAFGPA